MRPEIDQALDRLQGYAESALIFQCLRNGILDALDGGIDVARWSVDRKWDQLTTLGVCEFLVVAGLAIQQSSGYYQLTDSGRNCLAARGYYELLVGGYDITVRSLPRLLCEGPKTECRDFSWVSQGSADIGRFDSIPLTQLLLSRCPSPPKVIVDLGCGNASYLSAYLAMYPQAKIRGCDLSPASLENARRFLNASGQSDRIELIQHDASSFPFRGDEDIVVLAFVLHEIVGAQGIEVAQRFLQRIRNESPRASLVIIEVDGQPQVKQMQTKSGRGYYNLYMLLQRLTQQQLLPLSQWRVLLTSAGYHIKETEFVPLVVDDSKLEFGLLAIPQ